MNPSDMIIALGKQLDEEHNIAYDLWTWLPSHAVAKRHHEDYADTAMPSVHDVMLEAASYLCKLTKPGLSSPEDEMLFTRCPCGGDHSGK